VTIHCRKMAVEGQNEQTEISVSDHGMVLLPRSRSTSSTNSTAYPRVICTM
jgi:hypothetical protein